MNVHDLIACPYCRARVDQSCKNPRTGYPTHPHACRLAPRLCPCGNLPPPRATYCKPCRAERDAAFREIARVRYRMKHKVEVA